MVWFICKMCIQHMCTFVEENLMAKRLRGSILLALEFGSYSLQ